MIEYQNLPELLEKEMILFPKGKNTFVRKSENWTYHFYFEWNSKRIDLNIKSRKSNLKSDFVSCKIKKDYLFSIIARGDNYSFVGKTSDVSDLLLSNYLSLNLLNKRKSKIELDGKHLIYQCRISRKDDELGLVNVLKWIDLLTEDINQLMDKN